MNHNYIVSPIGAASFSSDLYRYLPLQSQNLMALHTVSPQPRFAKRTFLTDSKFVARLGSESARRAYPESTHTKNSAATWMRLASQR